MFRRVSFLLCLVTWTSSCFGEVPYCNPSDLDAADEQALFQLLLTASNYSSLDRPKVATNGTYGRALRPEFVEFEIRLDNLWDIMSRTTSFEYKSEVWLQWVDCRLAFKEPARGGNFSQIAMTYDTLLEIFDDTLIWVPMPIDYSAIRRAPANARTTVLFVEPNGVVRARLPQRGAARCPMNFKEVPFDRHTCTLLYASPEYDVSEVRYVLTPEPALFSGSMTNAEWDIDQPTALLTSKRVDLSKNRGFVYSAVKVDFRITRQPYYYIAQAVLPTLLFWAISYVGFFISYKVAPARSAIHMSAMLILVNHLKNVSDTLPTISYRTWLAQYIVSHLVVVGLQMCAFAATFYCNTQLVILNEMLKRKREDAEKEAGNTEKEAGDTEKEQEMDDEERLGFKQKFYQYGANLDEVSRIYFLALVFMMNLVFMSISDV